MKRAEHRPHWPTALGPTARDARYRPSGALEHAGSAAHGLRAASGRLPAALALSVTWTREPRGPSHGGRLGCCAARGTRRHRRRRCQQKYAPPSTGSGRRRRRRRSSRELDEVQLSEPEGRTQANRIACACTHARRPKMNKKLPTAIASPFGSSTTSNSLGGLDQHARRCSSEAARDTTLKALSVGQKSHEYELCIK